MSLWRLRSRRNLTPPLMAFSERDVIIEVAVSAPVKRVLCRARLVVRRRFTVGLPAAGRSDGSSADNCIGDNRHGYAFVTVRTPPSGFA